MELWHWFAFISVITVSIATLLERVLMREDHSDPIGYAIVFQFMLGIIAFIFTLLLGKWKTPPIQEFALYFGLASFLWAGYTVFSFKAAQVLGAGELIILSSGSTLITILLGVLFLQETITVSMGVGIALILAAVILVTTEKVSISSRRGLYYALIAMICSATAVIADAIILKEYEAFSYTTVMSILPGIILFMIFPKNLKRLFISADKKFYTTITIFCFFYVIQAITYYLAFQYNAPASQLSPIVKSSVVVTVLLAAIFLKERSQLGRKLIAAAITIVGVILIGE